MSTIGINIIGAMLYTGGVISVLANMPSYNKACVTVVVLVLGLIFTNVRSRRS